MRVVPGPPQPVPVTSPRDALLRKDDLLRFKPSDREAFELGWNAGYARGVASVSPVTCECGAVEPVLGASPVPVAEATDGEQSIVEEAERQCAEKGHELEGGICVRCGEEPPLYTEETRKDRYADRD